MVVELLVDDDREFQNLAAAVVKISKAFPFISLMY